MTTDTKSRVERFQELVREGMSLAQAMRTLEQEGKEAKSEVSPVEPTFVALPELPFRFHTQTAPVQPSWLWGSRIATLASLLGLWASMYGFAASDDPKYKIAYVLPSLIMAIPYIEILTSLRKNPPQGNTLARAVGIGFVTVFFAIWVGSVPLGATHAALVVIATKTFYNLRQRPGDTSKLIVRSVVYAFLFCWLAASAYFSLMYGMVFLGRPL